jgi:hypothetical protein
MDQGEHGRAAARIQQLLEDLQSLAGQPVWQRVEELVQRLLQLYGAGLSRLVDELRAAGRLEELLSRDAGGEDLLTHLLLLHELHPWPVAERVRRALDRARTQLEPQLGNFALLDVEAGRARVSLHNPPPLPAGLSAERLLLRAVADAAPEVTTIQVEGLPPPAPPELVQIDLRRARRAPEGP